MIDLITFATAVPKTLEWSPVVAIVMIFCNVVAIAFGKYTISQQNAAPALPSAEMFGGMGLPALLGVTCFGHILGVGVILGLANAGAI